MSPLLLALALAAPAAPAPLPRPAPPPPPLTRADLAGAYSGTWRGHPVAFRLTQDGRFVGWYDGDFWCGTYTVRGGVVCVREGKAADPGLRVEWWFRPVRGPGKSGRRKCYRCEEGPPPAEKHD